MGYMKQLDEYTNDEIAAEYDRRANLPAGTCHYCGGNILDMQCKVGHSGQTPLDPLADLIDSLAQACDDDSRRWFPWLYETQRSALVHMTLGLAGESGELANLVKKANRDGTIESLTIDQADAMAEEATDVLIYTLLFMHAVGRLPGPWLRIKRARNEERFGTVTQ